jgi:MerR family transcriptional regulator, light-induced transcriptional regulator
VSASDKPPDPVELSIGTLSSATGVPVDTLRTWERRYGFPAPTARAEGSHRRYPAETIGIVRLIVKALELGHRPSAVIGRDPEALRQLLSGALLADAGRSVATSTTTERVQHWLELTRELDGAGLRSEFQHCLAQMAALEFLERHMAPYLVALGQAWESGQLRVFHEHFASEQVRDFLSGQWRSLNERSDPGRAKIVLATPPGEQHVLGLHMAAWMIARAEARVVFLGANTPMAEVASAAERHAARGIALSIASGYSGDLAGHLRELTQRIAPRVSVAVGGGGGHRPEGVPAEQYLNSFSELLAWAEKRTDGPAP